MKKLLFLITLMFTMVFVNAQDTVTYNTKTGVVVDEVITRVETAIATLADKLQQPAEHVYKVLIQQQTVNAYVVLSTTILLIVLVMISLYLSLNKNSYKYYNDGSVDEVKPTAFIGFIAGTLAFLALLIYVCNNFIEMTTGFFNPEYGAIKEILNYL